MYISDIGLSTLYDWGCKVDMIKHFSDIHPTSTTIGNEARAHWDSIAHPLGGLGLLEEDITRIAMAQGSIHPDITQRALAIFCADNGVVSQGVTQCPSDRTALVAFSMAKGHSSVQRMASVANIDTVVVDVGIKTPVSGIVDLNVMRGTNDMSIMSAMTQGQCIKAIGRGASVARALYDKGYRLLVAGEMGIGNTTTSAAMTAAMLGVSPDIVTGRGAGLDDTGLKNKIAVIKRALSLSALDKGDILDIASRLGSLDIAAMAGFYLEAALMGIPVVLDGLISLTGALMATRLIPNSIGYMIASHMGGEKACSLIMKELSTRDKGLSPVIYAGLKLGEGTGAVSLLPLLDMAMTIYNDGETFRDIGIDPYRRYGSNGTI